MGKKNRRRNRSDSSATQSYQHSQSETRPSSADASTIISPYVVGRNDFSHLPRWTNDGIEQECQRNMSGENEKFHFDTNDPEQIALTQLLGGYPSQSPLNELPPDGRGFITNLPFMFQMKAAEEQSDIPSARTHLIEAYKQKDPDVIQLLMDINCQKTVYKASRDASRFPDFRAILVPLFQKNLAFDSNIEILFGKVAYVRHLLFDIGSQIAEPPPSNSPAGSLLSQFQYKENSKAALVPKSCSGCGSVSDGIVDYSKCSACKTVYYCRAECQRKHWPIHRPDCLRAQGKDVPQSAVTKAENAKKKKEKLENELNNQKKQHLENEFFEFCDQFYSESPSLYDSWAPDCRGKKLRIYVPSVNADNIIEVVGACLVGLKKVASLSLGMYPDGIDDTKYGFRGLDLVDPNNNEARIIVLFERLFSQRQGGQVGVGLHIDGVFVVDKVVRNRAKWKLVKEPNQFYQPDYNRRDRLVAYLNTAKIEAKAVSQAVDLGIHNPGDPKLSITPTPVGDHVNVERDGFRH
ncbi:MAG: hypothetical protein ACI8RD_010504 [Bacillariaceae sp.]|jgi:hypothetical protein